MKVQQRAPLLSYLLEAYEPYLRTFKRKGIDTYVLIDRRIPVACLFDCARI